MREGKHLRTRGDRKMEGGWLPGLIPSGHPSELEGHTVTQRMTIHHDEWMSAEEDPPQNTIGSTD